MRWSLLRVAVVGLLVWAPVEAVAQGHALYGLSPAKARAVDGAMREEMAKQEVVGLAIGIVQKGRVVYVQGYGLADREKQSPVTTHTVFNWASNTKPMTAVLAMQLVEKGLLDLDADVRKYVPEFPDKGVTITPRHLLCHQSGIPHYSNGKIIPTTRTYAVDHPFLDPVVALDRFKDSPLLFNPGEKKEYSSYAYLLLSAVIQRAGKEPFDKQVHERIAKPLRLKSLELDLDFKGQANWAAGYLRKKNHEIVPAPEEARYSIHGGGGYKSNIEDFARWAEALLDGKLVSKESEQQMWTPQKTAHGKVTDWGLGFEIGDQRGLKVSHNGSHPEVTTRMVLYPRAGEGVVVMCNCQYGSPGAFSTKVFEAMKE